VLNRGSERETSGREHRALKLYKEQVRSYSRFAEHMLPVSGIFLCRLERLLRPERCSSTSVQSCVTGNQLRTFCIF
jgi:hypothetical protein